MPKKYCPALVVMLYTVLEYSHKRICETTGYTSSGAGNIISREIGPARQRGHIVRAKWGIEKNEDLVEVIERDYLTTNASAREIGERYGITPQRVGKLMRARGHVRGKGGGAVKRNNELRRKDAIAKITAECGDVENIESLDHKLKREMLMSSRKRDYGITWKSLSRRNGSMRCEVCGIECDPNDKSWGSSGPTHPSVDHIVRICDGGEDTWDNSRLTCMRCNLKLNAEANRSREEVCA